MRCVTKAFSCRKTENENRLSSASISAPVTIPRMPIKPARNATLKAIEMPAELRMLRIAAISEMSVLAAKAATAV